VLHVPLGLWSLIIPLVSSSSSFNSDGQQFHQYQQNEQSYITSTYLTLKKSSGHVTLEI
jgi:hypothetical protein